MQDHDSKVRELALGAGQAMAPNAFVFSHHIDGVTPVHPDNMSKAFERIRGKYGSVRLHDLRHAHATQLIANGVDIPTVSKRSRLPWGFNSVGRHIPQVHTSPGPAHTPPHDTKHLVTSSRPSFGHPQAGPQLPERSLQRIRTLPLERTTPNRS